MCNVLVGLGRVKYHTTNTCYILNLKGLMFDIFFMMEMLKQAMHFKWDFFLIFDCTEAPSTS